MDLFQPVTLFVHEGDEPKSLKAFANLRLAVLSVMSELAPPDREKALIRGKDGEINYSGISQLFEDLQPRTVRVMNY